METTAAITKEDLIEGLNRDLAYEYQAILMYTTYAAMASGIHRPILKTFFEEEIPEELSHAHFLADKVTALGGTPTTEPAPFPLSHDNHSMLKQALGAETETIERYVSRRQEAEGFGDYGLAAEVDEIIRDETRHKEETEKLLRTLEP